MKTLAPMHVALVMSLLAMRLECVSLMVVGVDHQCPVRSWSVSHQHSQCTAGSLSLVVAHISQCVICSVKKALMVVETHHMCVMC